MEYRAFSHPDVLLKFLSSLDPYHCWLIECVKVVVVEAEEVDIQSHLKFGRELSRLARSPLPEAETKLKKAIWKKAIWNMVVKRASLKLSAINVAYDSPWSRDMEWQLRAWDGVSEWLKMISRVTSEYVARC